MHWETTGFVQKRPDVTESKVTQAAPRGLKAAGRELWDSLCSDYVFEPFETSMLLQAAQTCDHIAALQAVIEKLGVDCALKELAEIRQQRLAFARQLVALRLPSGLEGEGQTRRPQRRAIRGVYRGGG
jgi:hypothetical protein